MQYNPYSQEFIRSVLKENKLWLSKDRGQNYLIDRNTAEKITEIVYDFEKAFPAGGDGPKDKRPLPVFEVGCGLGSLTSLLVRRYKTYSLEIDGGVCRLFGNLFQDNNLIILNEDFLKFNMSVIPEEKMLFVSNLPYSISGEAIKKFIESEKFDYGIVMLQKEFAGRMTASPGHEGYGVFSILAQFYLDIKILFEVGKKSFFPVPTVDSVVVKIEKKVRDISQSDFNFFLRKAFRAKRKTLFNNLKDYGFTVNILNDFGIDPKLRPEEIDIKKWVDLFYFYNDRFS